MRASIALVALLLAASPAAAGPSCVDRRGETIRCGTAGAMPVGWDLPPGEQAARRAARSSELGPGQLAGLLLFVGGLFALFALLPDFDGAWDEADGDAGPEPPSEGSPRRPPNGYR